MFGKHVFAWLLNFSSQPLQKNNELYLQVVRAEAFFKSVTIVYDDTSSFFFLGHLNGESRTLCLMRYMAMELCHTKVWRMSLEESLKAST